MRQKAYGLYDPHANKLVISRDVIFDEATSWSWKKIQALSPNIIKEERRGPTPNQDPPSPRCLEPSSSGSDSPPRKVRYLQDIYDSCDKIFFTCEPQKFEA